MQLLTLLFSGLVIGSLTGLLGIGSGLFLVPVMTEFIHLSFPQAVATALCINFLQALINSFTYYKKGLLDLSAAKLLCFPMAFFSFGTAKLGQYLSSEMMRYSFIATNIFVVAMPALLSPQAKKILQRYKKQSCIFFGSIIGALSGITGIGGGGLLSFILLSTKLVNEKKAAAVANSAVATTSLFAIIGYLSHRHVDLGQTGLDIIRLDVMAPLFIAGIIGGQWGIKLNDKISMVQRKLGLALVFSVVLLKLLLF